MQRPSLQHALNKQITGSEVLWVTADKNNCMEKGMITGLLVCICVSGKTVRDYLKRRPGRKERIFWAASHDSTIAACMVQSGSWVFLRSVRRNQMTAEGKARKAEERYAEGCQSPVKDHKNNQDNLKEFKSETKGSTVLFT